jgi:hypothetical protein
MNTRRMRRCASAAALVLLAGGCGPRADAEEVADADAAGAGDEGAWACRIVTPEVTLGDPVREASGASLDRRTPGVFWTHGDSGNPPVLFALGRNGELLGRVPLAGARNRDWEDMAIGPCPGGTCVYVADIGNNNAREMDLVLYRAPVPSPGDAATAPAEAFRARFPGAGRDAEGVFVMPQGEIYLVTKGASGPVELWRWPTPLRAGTVQLERVRELAPRVQQLGDLVTGAGASQDGRWVALRTYGRLAIYRAADLLGTGGPAYTMDLAPLGESFGEAVAMESDGTLLLVSEGRGTTTGSRAAWLQCALPET